jgi:Cu(I)/Ag(I) efflux system membrane fusion protein/cobalt-zinc-cadmium efflux system membrane fusion protein
MNSENSNLRQGFAIAILGNVVLAAALIGFWWHSRAGTVGTNPFTSPMQMQAPSATSGSNSGPASGSEGNSEPNGTPTGPVQLTPQRMQSIGVKLGQVQRKAVNDELRFAGNVDVDERRLSTVQLRFPGWIHKVFVDATYDYVHKGQPLFTIYSPDLVTTEQEYLLARKNQQQLGHSSVDGVAAGADTLVSAAKERLQQWEVPASEIAKLDSSDKVITDLTINSPVSGYITERNALPNMYVQPETKLYSVADLSTVWVYAQLFQTDVGRITPGNSATVTVDAYPGKVFKGRVDSILPQVDVNTRTVRARLVFPNPKLLLKPGMYVNVVLRTPIGRSLVVPASAVFHSGTSNLVFLNQGNGNLLPREVDLGPRVGDDYAVVKGLKQGDSIVISANFLIDSEAQLQAAAGAFVPPPPGAGTAAAMNGPSGVPPANVELTTDPSPPTKGNNTFRVKLTAANGSPISGAQVNVTFYMAAMPGMGMAAMKTSVDLSDKGNGLYEGKGNLGSGGTWQAAITARPNGAVIANKQLTVNATGGM